MTVYDLYLESGPRRRKTMVHVLDLLGCVAVGPTTEDAMAATPDAIRAYGRFLSRHGEAVNLTEPIELRVAEHVTEGQWLGNGSPYLVFAWDLAPLGDEEIETNLNRFRWLREALAAWAETQSDAELAAAPPERGRPAREILLHTLGATGGYLSAALGSAPGFSTLHGAAERGGVSLPVALRRSVELATDRITATAPEERAAVRQLPAGPRTLRKALRRMLEHDWEHLAELSRRPGGPAL
jgi:predicted RNase H-like HicB family nuclease